MTVASSSKISTPSHSVDSSRLASWSKGSARSESSRFKTAIDEGHGSQTRRTLSESAGGTPYGRPLHELGGDSGVFPRRSLLDNSAKKVSSKLIP